MEKKKGRKKKKKEEKRGRVGSPKTHSRERGGGGNTFAGKCESVGRGGGGRRGSRKLTIGGKTPTGSPFQFPFERNNVLYGGKGKKGGKKKRLTDERSNREKMALP